MYVNVELFQYTTDIRQNEMQRTFLRMTKS